MLKKILLAVVALVAVVLLYAATRPDSFRVERSVSIQAPPQKIFAIINDLHQWSTWSPWEKLDPDMKRTYSGAQSGPGAAYAWEGNSKVGAGRMEIVEGVPPSRVGIKLDFLKPFEAHNNVDLTLTPQGEATHVVWSIHGPMPYISKVMCLFVSMDKMMGKDFETGLANLKAAAEQ